MKNKKHKLFMILIFIISLIAFLNDSLLNIRAEQFETDKILQGQYYRSGDIIKKKTFVSEEYPDKHNFYRFESEIFKINKITDDGEYIYSEYYDNYVSEEFGKEYYEFPQYEEKDVLWKIGKTRTDDYYNQLVFELYPIYYIDPVLKLSCDKDKIMTLEKTNCKLELNYSYDVRTLNFKILHDNFDVENFKGTNTWEISLDNEKYKMLNKNNVDFKQKNIINKEIATFTLVPKDIAESTNLYNNIEIDSISYSDVFISDKISKTNTTVNIIAKRELNEEIKQEHKNEEIKKEEIVNPNTGCKGVIKGLIILVFIGILIKIVLKKYNFFGKV